VINILSERQADVSAAFAVSWSDKFGHADWRMDDGLPVLDGTLAHLTGTVSATFDGGDHLIVVMSVATIVENDTAALPLLYFRSSYRNITEAPA
jgi:3-hydroxy-9,10-secoandrosta-1,3,5(10)-triene-9,17-dione monooxygenase reductase component